MGESSQFSTSLALRIGVGLAPPPTPPLGEVAPPVDSELFLGTAGVVAVSKSLRFISNWELVSHENRPECSSSHVLPSLSSTIIFLSDAGMNLGKTSTSSS